MLTKGAKFLDPEDHIIRQTFSGSNLIYVGRAIPGSSESDPVWQIYEYTYSGSKNTEINFASGSNEFKHQWSERENYEYS